MTNREAIEIIKVERACVKRNTDNKCDRDCINCDLLRTDEEIFAAYDMAIEALKKAEKFQWIPVSERLPETYKKVIINVSRNSAISHKKHDFVTLGIMNALGEWGYGEWEDVIAWMPLPEPFRFSEQLEKGEDE